VPALLENEVGHTNAPPVKLRLFGEDLIVFRDVHGRVAIAPAYPTVVRGGVVWTYMGPQDFLPQLPDFAWSYAPEARRYANKRAAAGNWALALESTMDAPHLPISDVKDVEYGLLIGARTTRDDRTDEWRITQFLLPFYTIVPPPEACEDPQDEPFHGFACVPIDDDNTWVWSFGANPLRDWTPAERAVQATAGDGVHATESAERSEHGVADFRHLMVKLARENARGHVPEAAQHGSWYAVRSATLHVERGVPFDTASH